MHKNLQMEKRTYWPFSVRNFPQNKNVPIEEIEVDPNIMKSIYENCFYGKAKEWLHSLPIDSIKTWNDLKEAFIKK